MPPLQHFLAVDPLPIPPASSVRVPRQPDQPRVGENHRARPAAKDGAASGGDDVAGSGVAAGPLRRRTYEAAAKTVGSARPAARTSAAAVLGSTGHGAAGADDPAAARLGATEVTNTRLSAAMRRNYRTQGVEGSGEGASVKLPPVIPSDIRRTLKMAPRGGRHPRRY